MLRRRIRSTFRCEYMPSALALLALQSACDPKWRELKEDAPNSPDQGQARLQPARDETPSNTADAVSSSSDGVEVVCSDGDCPQVAGAVDSSDTCGSGGDAGTCSPLPLCEGDAGACEATCPGCFVEETCVAGDAVNPGNPCLICNPEIDPRGWSNNDGVTCDDGLFCTTDDVCAASVCKSTPRQCEDGVACNGVSKCDETAAKCTDDVNQCGANALCNVQTDSCVSTCPGCIINGVCLPVGTEASGNPCLVCDPTRSTTTFSAAAGKNCGAGPTACSQQDTCNGQGVCQPNHLPVTSSCGNPASGSCDQPDTCDGNGNCQQRLSQNGAACDDGAFCTTGDQCQGGQCRPTGNQNCGANRTCNEAANQCQCQGCQIGNTCVAPGSGDPANACQICDLSRSATAYSVNVGASCGSPATECSGQDTCNAQGQCAANNLDNTSCQQNAGLCVGGTCRPGLGRACQQGGTPCANNLPCTNGVCQVPTVGNGAACGVNASCNSAVGLQCLASGTCGCPAGRHFCGGGITSCSANNDITHCAVTSTTCTDCTQANANAACGGTGCNNTCRGTTLSCPGTGGKPNCGSWDFETGIQGWVAGPGTVGAMTIRVSAAQHVSGTNSLAVAFSPPFLPDGSVTNGSYRIQVSLCGGSAIDLRGKRLQAQIFIDADPANTLPAAGADTYDAPRAAPVALNSVPLTTRVWTSVTTDPLPAGTGVSSETNIGFEVVVKFGSSPTPGTIFFDDISVL